jgi:hypothetical protein
MQKLKDNREREREEHDVPKDVYVTCTCIEHKKLCNMEIKELIMTNLPASTTNTCERNDNVKFIVQ